jgi:hypothetical protein
MCIGQQKAEYKAKLKVGRGTPCSWNACYELHGYPGLLYALNRGGTGVGCVELWRSSNTYQVQASVVNDGMTWSGTAWAMISDVSHKLEIDWKAASAAGANKGKVTFWVDGVQKGTFTNIDNDTCWVDYVQLEAVNGVDSSTIGSYFINAFVSRRDGSIGLRHPDSPQVGRAMQHSVQAVPGLGG